MTKSPKLVKRYDVLMDQIDPTVAKLKLLCKSSPQQMEAIDRIEDSAKRTRQLLEGLKDSVRLGGSSMGSLTSMEVLAEAKQCVRHLTDELATFEDTERGRGEVDPAKQERFRQTLKLAVMVGAALTLLIGILMAMLFSRGIVTRLQMLSENSMRLSRSEPLLPLSSGHDEIAHVDNVFHTMAEALSEAHREVALSEQRMRSIVESVPVALFVTKGELVETMNSGARDLCGEQLVGGSIVLALGTKLISLRDGLVEAVPHTGNPRALLTHSGQNIFVDVDTALFETVDGARTLVMVADVSERQKLAELRQHFVAMITHDLKTPLTSVQILLEGLILGAYGEQSDSSLLRFRRGHKSVVQLVDLIMDLLDFEKSDAGMMQINPKDTHLSTILTQSFEAVESLAEASGIEIVLEYEDASLFVDERRLVRVIINLLSNAIKFSPEGSLVTIKAGVQNDELEIHVKDQGKGIAPDLQAIIFDPYRHSESIGNSKGTGLGLANCKAIVQAHGGTINVCSEPGKGTDFWFVMPHHFRSSEHATVDASAPHTLRQLQR